VEIMEKGSSSTDVNFIKFFHKNGKKIKFLKELDLPRRFQNI